MTNIGAPDAGSKDDKSALRPAATVMLIRDRDASSGFEVFMVQRSHTAAFAGGMYVFPGGRVDATDGGSELGEFCDGLDDAQASALLQITVAAGRRAPLSSLEPASGAPIFVTTRE
ncbi:MAG: hypothetical protein ACKO92_01895 [Actinomycetota bacterium]